MPFEWDPNKERVNQRKHGVSFRQAQELLESNEDHLEIFDEEHSIREDRFIAIGPIRDGVVVVVWTERTENVVRIISARMATKREVALYRDHTESAR